MIVRAGASSFEQTVAAMTAGIGARGLRIFGEVDHGGGARDAGLELADEKVIVFGSPQAGTPLMQSDPRVGIELPLRILIWREDDRVMLAYNDPRELAGEYRLQGHEATLEQMAGLLAQLVNEAAA